MKPLSIVCLLLLLAQGLICQPALAEPKEWMSIPSNEGKSPKFAKDFNDGALRVRRLVLEGDSEESWTECLEIVVGQRDPSSSTVSEMFNELIEKRKAECPSMKYSIVDRKPDSMLFEIRTKRCGDAPAEYSITRILFSPNCVHMAIYRNRTPNVQEKIRDEWRRRLSSVNIVSQQ